jgi:predicted ATPase
LEDESSGGSSFVHDKLREVAYGLIGSEERRRLHQRAAEALTRRQDGGAVVEAGTLGYHHAHAGNHELAAGHFERAAEAARRNHANRDALRYFRLALGELERAELQDEPEHRVGRSRLREAIADVLFVFGELDEARTMLEGAIEETPAADRVGRARRRRLQARTWERMHQHERALALCARAELDLGEPPRASRPAEEFWFEWVQIQIQITGHLYFLNKVVELQALLERVRPLIEQRGSPLQRAQFLQGLIHANMRSLRYRLNADSLQLARAALAAAEQTQDPGEIALARGYLAVVLTFTGMSETQEAEGLFKSAIAHVERVSDASLQARFLSYYCMLLRRAHRLADARVVAQRALEISERYRFFDYIGVAQANLSWVALETGGDVQAAADKALGAWGQLPAAYTYPLQWIVRMPLAVHLTRVGKLDEALSQWQLLLDTRQHLLPDELSAAIELALQKRAGSAADEASLESLAELARALRYI